jgi:hypothetical protein
MNISENYKNMENIKCSNGFTIGVNVNKEKTNEFYINNNKNMEELKQGTKIEFDVQSLTGTGKIVGIATVAMPLIGTLYIIEPDEPINSEAYDYSHFTAWGCQIKEIK